MKIHPLKIDFYVTEQIKRYVFVYLLEGKHCYLIDSGVHGSESVIESFLKSIGKKTEDIRGIFLTHAHPDHIGTAAYFQNRTQAKIYASEQERPWIESIDLQFKERPILNFYNLAGASAKVDRIVRDGDEIFLDEDFSIQVVGTPGHSAGELSYLVENAAFIGDAVPVKNDIPIYIDRRQTLESLQKISRLSAKTFYPAWDRCYTPETMGEKIQEAREIVKDLDRAVKSVLEEEPTSDLSELVGGVCKRLGKPYLKSNPLFMRTVRSHLEEGR